MLEVSKMSSLNTFVELANRLNGKIGELYMTYSKGLIDKGNTRLWKGYYKGQMTMWFIHVWPDFKCSCNTLSKVFPESQSLKEIAGVKITAYTSDKDRWTKGDAFKVVFANMEQALKDCGKEDVAKSLMEQFKRLTDYIDENSESDTSRSSMSSTYSKPKFTGNTKANVELIVNVAILKMPKHLVQEARTFIFSKSDLQQGLKEFKVLHNLT